MGISYFKKNKIENFITNDKSNKPEVKIVNSELILKYTIDKKVLSRINSDNFEIIIRNKNFNANRRRSNTKVKNYQKNKNKIAAYKNLYADFKQRKKDYFLKNNKFKFSINLFKENNTTKNLLIKKINKTKNIKKTDVNTYLADTSENITKKSYKNAKYLTGKKDLKDKKIQNNFTINYNKISKKPKFIDSVHEENIKIVTIKIPLSSLKLDLQNILIFDLIIDNQLLHTFNLQNGVESKNIQQHSANTSTAMILPRFDQEKDLFDVCFVKKNKKAFLRIVNNETNFRNYVVLIKETTFNKIQNKEKIIDASVKPFSKTDIQVNNLFNTSLSLEAKVFLKSSFGIASNYKIAFFQIPQRNNFNQKILIDSEKVNKDVRFVLSQFSDKFTKARILKRNMSLGEKTYMPVHQKNSEDFKPAINNQEYFDYDENLIDGDQYEYIFELIDYKENISQSQVFNYIHSKQSSFFEFDINFINYFEDRKTCSFDFSISQDYFLNKTLSLIKSEAIGNNYLGAVIVNKILENLENKPEIYEYFKFHLIFTYTSLKTGEKTVDKKLIIGRNTGRVITSLSKKEDYRLKIELEPEIKPSFLRDARIERINDKKYKESFKRLLRQGIAKKSIPINLVSETNASLIISPEFRLLDQTPVGRKVKTYSLLKFNYALSSFKKLDYLKVYLCYEETGKIVYYGKAYAPLGFDNFREISINYYIDYTSYRNETVVFKCQPVYEDDTESEILDIISVNSTSSRLSLY